MRFLSVFMLLLVSALSAVADDSTYRLQAGDRLSVSVWQEEDLQKEVVVAPDGTIAFPLVGHFRVQGRTAGEVEQILTAKLKDYITSPVVSVAYLAPAPAEADNALEHQRIFVTGQVRNAGAFEVTEATTVMQAISMAGGLSEFAAERRIKVLRQTRDGEITLEFDYVNVSKGWDTSTNITLRDGDVVIVPDRGLFGGLFE